MLEESGFVCINASNQPQGVDDMSGGYPYVASDPAQVHFWQSQKEAEHYAKMFGFKVVSAKRIVTWEGE